MAFKSLEKKVERSVDVPEYPLYPQFYVDGTQMPEIDSWKIDEEYTLTVKVKLCDYSSHEDKNGTRSYATLNITSYDTKAEKRLS